MPFTTPVRFAQFNASLNRDNPGELIRDLSTPNNPQAKAVAEIIQRTNPDVLTLQEFDFDPNKNAARLFQQNYLSLSQNGAAPVNYPFVYVAPSNTGIASGFDLDNNGSIVTTPAAAGYGNDALGFGNFPGQFAMVLFSKYPIETSKVRTFQNFLWKDMPGALLPDNPTTPTPNDWYSPEELAKFPLSSKSHWDIPININGEIVHVLASHPTPPVFDGAEDRNGRRNHDEIRFWADYITPGKSNYIYDDTGKFGGFDPGGKFVIMGDLNADILDGDSTNNPMRLLLNNSLVNGSATPQSKGGREAALQGGNNANHRGNPAFDTADFADTGTNPGNLRVDYALPSANLRITASGVFWPPSNDARSRLTGTFSPTLPPPNFPSSDHRLVFTNVVSPVTSPVGETREKVTDIDFLGEAKLNTGLSFNGTEVGGLSGIVYDRTNNVYYSLSDDRSEKNPARFYTLGIDLNQGKLTNESIRFLSTTPLLDRAGQTFPRLSLDPEGIALGDNGVLYVSSEGDVTARINPFINKFSLTGRQFEELPIPGKFLIGQDRGIRNNLAFESLTISPNQKQLFTATESSLQQDGPVADLEDGSFARLLQYNLETGQPAQEFLYITEPVAKPANPADAFKVNGLVDLLAIDNTGSFLALERSFSTGVGNTIKLFQVNTQGATDISSIPSLNNLEVDAPVSKKLLLDFDRLGITLDNIEGMTFGPKLPDGRQSLIIVGDNNFSPTQFTQVLAFAIDTETIPTIKQTTQTPPVEDRSSPPTGITSGDADDPAIYVHPNDPARSVVIGSLKDGGLQVYDLDGKTLQTVVPGGVGRVRYNNVDLVYNFPLGRERVDLAIASDRRNDKLAIFRIDPNSRQLSDVTSSSIGTIFTPAGSQSNGTTTAYGLASYTSPVDGKSYAFVSQRERGEVAQLELVDDGTGRISARKVRTISLPTPAGGELEDAQIEGMVADRELGQLYIGQENVGIWKFTAEANGGNTGLLIDSTAGDRLVADVEGLTIHYGNNGNGYLLVSSQGDSTFAAYDRRSNTYLGQFAIPGVEESDGADIVNLPLGPKYPNGLLVVHDGSYQPQTVIVDDGEVGNISTNFNYVSLQDLSRGFPRLESGTSNFNPRNPQPQGLLGRIASGDTTSNSTVLWGQSNFPGRMTFSYFTDPNFTNPAGTKIVNITDPTQPVKVEVTELTPGSTYYYRVTDAIGSTATGKFKTAVPPNQTAGLRFGVSGDWRGELSPYPAIANVPDRQLDFFVLHGDTIYSDFPSPAYNGEQARSIAEYRAKHNEVYSGRFGLNTWGNLRANTSILATIDDHEVINDFAGGALASSDQRFGTNTGLINDTPLFENGMQAFQEYNPIRDEFYPNTGDPRTAGERKLYRYNTYGKDAAAFVLDTRSFRDAQLPGVTNPSDRNQIASFLAASANPQRTMLGRQQIADLKRDLLDAQSKGLTWKFIMVPEPIQNLGVVGAADRFEGYAAERTDLLRFINENRIDNVVFIGADIHGTLVNNITYQNTPGGPQIPTGVFEITTGSVAFDAPLGPTVVEIAAQAGLATPQQVATYKSLPRQGKDAFIEQFVNAQLAPLGYDPVGLQGSPINSQLLSGSYVAANTFGWTEFNIDRQTQQLRVTTYGIDPYTQAEMEANPNVVANRRPSVVSDFIVTPQGSLRRSQTIEGDILTGTDGQTYQSLVETGGISSVSMGDSLLVANSSLATLNPSVLESEVLESYGGDFRYNFQSGMFGFDANSVSLLESSSPVKAPIVDTPWFKDAGIL